jgi:hypothetical protein
VLTYVMDSTSAKALEQKRPALHKLIDELPETDLEVVERLLARMGIERLWGALREGFTQDWANGNYERLDEIILEVRADFRQRAA